MRREIKRFGFTRFPQMDEFIALGAAVQLRRYQHPEPGKGSAVQELTRSSALYALCELDRGVREVFETSGLDWTEFRSLLGVEKKPESDLQADPDLDYDLRRAIERFSEKHSGKPLNLPALALAIVESVKEQPDSGTLPVRLQEAGVDLQTLAPRLTSLAFSTESPRKVDSELSTEQEPPAVEPDSKRDTRLTPSDQEESLPQDAEAVALLEASYRIGAASKAQEHHSYTSLLVACMLADNSASRWFKRRLAELKIEVGTQTGKLGLPEEELLKLTRGDSSHAQPNKDREWSQSATQWYEKAVDLARSVGGSTSPKVTARDLVAAFVFARRFHEGDRETMGLGQADDADDHGVELANGFLSFVLTRHANEYTKWEAVFIDEFRAEPTPDVLEGPSTLLSSDRWTTEDRLGYQGYARAIRHFLVHPQTKPPLSISIQAPWGAGKTSLMRMVQRELDPEAVEAAKAGGWNSLRTEGLARSSSTSVSFHRLFEIIGGEKTEGNQTSKGTDQSAFQGQPPKRFTVWFNAWKYESGNQLWAGLATAIIEQITARMKPLNREEFLLRLQLARIDPAKVRSQIYELAFVKTLGALKYVRICICGAILTALGGLLQWIPGIALQGGLLAGVALSVISVVAEVARQFVKKMNEVEKGPVSTTLKNVVSVPDYSSEIGFTHRVVEDLERIFEVLGNGRAIEQAKPLDPSQKVESKTDNVGSGEGGKGGFRSIVVFIDDLDRCSPARVADVIEGVNMFLAGDFMPCVFVIGMDPQMVSAALEKAHEEVTSRLPRYDRQTPLGWRFMDKFVQLPFTIPPPGPEKLEEFTEYLLHGSEVEAIVAEGQLEAQQSAADITSRRDAEDAAKRVASAVASRRKLDEPLAQAVAVRVLKNSFALRLQDRMSENFTDSNPIVQEMLREAARSFSNNPREIKRLLNVVRFQYLIGRARVADDQEIPDADVMGKWTALSLRWPAFARWLQWSSPREQIETEQVASGEVVKSRLEIVERLSREALDFEEWRKKVHEALGLQDGDIQWDKDPNLRGFLGETQTKPLSAGAGLGFY